MTSKQPRIFFSHCVISVFQRLNEGSASLEEVYKDDLFTKSHIQFSVFQLELSPYVVFLKSEKRRYFSITMTLKLIMKCLSKKTCTSLLGYNIFSVRKDISCAMGIMHTAVMIRGESRSDEMMSCRILLYCM